MIIRRRRLLVAAVLAPLMSRAALAQSSKARRVALLISIPKSDPEAKERLSALTLGLSKLGWQDGKNVRLDYRFADGDIGRLPKLAKELIDLHPDVIFASGTQAAVAVRQQTLSTPIVFVQVSDPVGMGLLTNLGRPEGNITGIINFPFSIASKWLQVLKECAPATKRVGLLFDPSNSSWPPYMRSVETSAKSFGVEVVPISVHDVADVKAGMAAFGKQPGGALLVLPGPLMTTNRRVVVGLANDLRLPAVYPYSYFATAGGLMSYGIDAASVHRDAASYLSQLLRGAKISDLPVEQPSKLDLVVNVKTAKALGLKLPQSLLALADRLIE